MAKAVFNLNATRQLLDRLSVDVSLRRICGWVSQREVPHESQFSRAFADFAASELPQRLHEALIKATQQKRLIGHISRDSTEIEVREKPLRTPVSITPAKSMRKRGRPKSGEQPLPPILAAEARVLVAQVRSLTGSIAELEELSACYARCAASLY